MMVRYLLGRLAYGILVIILVVLTISSIIYLAPVDPAQLTFGQRADVATVKAKTAELGLDQPLYVQLLHYLSDISPISVIHTASHPTQPFWYGRLISWGGNSLVLKTPYLRDSYQTGRPVSAMLAAAIPATALLASTALLFALLLGIPMGVLAALRPRSIWDHSISVLSVLGYSLPSYVAAMLMALCFGYALGAITGLNIQGGIFVLDDFGDWHTEWKNLILPAIALGMRPVALITQLTRSAMLDVLSQDYVRTAVAKGLSFYQVVFKHALRNALNPLVSAVSSWFAALLTGAFFVENVFSFKGLGDLTIQALVTFDLPVVLGCVLFTATVFVVINLITDLLYVWVDPRVRVG
jgi:peptide/nickel transport system permease protein